MHDLEPFLLKLVLLGLQLLSKILLDLLVGLNIQVAGGDGLGDDVLRDVLLIGVGIVFRS